MNTRAYFAGRFVAQEARRAGNARADDREYGAAGARFVTGTGRTAAHIDTVPPPLERDVLAAILEMLALDRRVAWAHRFNTGQFENANGQAVRFAFKGCSDILGQLCNGLFLAIEVKRPGKTTTPDQQAFLDRVNAAGGVAFCATSLDDVQAALARLKA